MEDRGKRCVVCVSLRCAVALHEKEKKSYRAMENDDEKFTTALKTSHLA